MKNNHKVLSILIVLTMLVSIITLCTATANAQEQCSGSTQISFTPPGGPAAKYKLCVSIVGNGCIFDGSQEIKGSINYQLSQGQEKTFRVQPQHGYVLKSILFDNTDITNMAGADGTITIQGKSGDARLVITFGGEDGTSQSPSSGHTKNNVKTGDATASIAGWLAFAAILSGYTAWLAAKKKKL